MRCPLLLLVSGGCNSLLHLDQTKEIDAYIKPDAVGCSGAKFVGTTSISVVGDEQIFDPSQSNDPLELWFTWQVSSSVYHIASMTRSAPDQGFDMPTVAPFMHSNRDTDPSITSDGLHVLFMSSDSRIYQTDRATRQASWATPTIIAGIDGQDAGLGFDVSLDGLVIYFVDGAGDLHTATRSDPTAGFGAVTDLAVGLKLMFPSISPDQRELFFNPAMPSQELHRITRDDPALDFDVTTDEILLQVAADPDVSPDSRTLVYHIAGDLKATHRDCP